MHHRDVCTQITWCICFRQSKWSKMQLEKHTPADIKFASLPEGVWCGASLRWRMIPKESTGPAEIFTFQSNRCCTGLVFLSFCDYIEVFFEAKKKQIHSEYNLWQKADAAPHYHKLIQFNFLTPQKKKQLKPNNIGINRKLNHFCSVKGNFAKLNLLGPFSSLLLSLN